MLLKQRNKVQKQLAEIDSLAGKQRSGKSLQPNQLKKLARRAEVEEMLRQVYLQGTSEQRERLGVCGKCGRHGHSRENCPRATAVETKPMPLSASASSALQKAAEEAAEPDRNVEEGAHTGFQYFDPVRLSLLQ